MQLLAVQAIETGIVEAAAADVPTFAPVAADKLALITALFVPSKSLVFADLTLATFTGSAPKAGAAGTQQAGIDPLTARPCITLLAPAGGWRWECTVAPAAPGETVYGVAWLDNAGAVLKGTGLLPVPKTVSAVGHFVDIGDAVVVFPTPLSQLS